MTIRVRDSGTVLAVIVAPRDGHGAPRLSGATILGAPSFVHAARVASLVRGVRAVVVATDDPALARTAEDLGLDSVTVAAGEHTLSPRGLWAARAAYAALTPAGREAIASVVVLSARAPAVDVTSIEAAVGLLAEEHADSVVGVTSAFETFWSVSDTGPVELDRTAPWREAETLYVLRPELLVPPDAANPLGARRVLFPLDQTSAFRLSRVDDIPVAEGLVLARYRGTAAELCRSVELLVFDFDGVMTDNAVLVMQDGTEGVLCNRSDGLGIEALRKAGVPAFVLSKEQNPVVAARCRKLKLDCIQGIDDKRSELLRQLEARGVAPASVAYMGNDVNDLPCMTLVGLPIAVADAYPRVLAAARLVTRRPGGHGAVREVVEWVLAARGVDLA